MYRKIQTSNGKRKFYHQSIQKQGKLQTQNSIIRPPTSHPYSGLNNNRFSGQNKNKFDSNYFKQGIMPQRRQILDQKCIRTQLKQIQVEKLPKHFKHLLGQLKVLRKNNFQDENSLQIVIKSICQKVTQMNNQINFLQRENQAKQQKIQQILRLNEQLQKKNNDQQLTSNKKVQKLNSKKMEFEIMLQNIKLSQLNQNYLNKIKELANKKEDAKNIQIQNKNQESQYNTEVLRFHNRINYLQMKLLNSQTIQTNLLSKNQALTLQIDELKNQNKQLKIKIQQLLENRNQWRERAIMQKEDAQTNLARQNFLLFSIKKLRESNKNLLDKLINLGTSDNRKSKQIQTNPYFQYEVDFFKSLKTVYFDAKFKQYKISLQNKNQNLQMSPLSLQKDYISYRRLEQVNLASLSYFRPTFYSFIEESATSDIYSCRVKGNTSVSRIFIQVLRSILNCKINQFVIVGQEQKYTRFPQFVYSWFQKFYFNSQKNIITALQPFMQKPISQDVFYRDLMNVKLDQSWEIITFRQFLLEQLNLQQLYFYLMCQNLLYKKAGITQQIQYFGEFCILAEYSAAKSVLDLVLSDFQSWNISFLASKLRQKVIVKKNIEYIQCGFFLRCLVEYYKIERCNRYKYICKLCEQFKSCQENGLRFSSFISVINRFTEISVQQKTKIYRNCFSVSRGKITADVIYTVCSQQLVFLRYLKLKCFFKIPTLIKHKQYKKGQKKIYQTNENQQLKQQIICVQPSFSYIYDIFIGLNRLIRNEEGFIKRIESLGVIQLLNNMVSLKKMFSSKTGSQDCSVMKGKHFIHYINETMQKIRQINYQNFYQLLDQNNKKKSNSSFWIQIDEVQLCQIFTHQIKTTFETFQKINEYKTWKNKVYNFRLNNAARKIQKQVRKKFIQPFMQLYKIIYSELKKTDSEEKTF